MVSEKRNYYKNVSQIEKESEKIITTRMWFSGIIIALQSFLLGFCVVNFNPCLVTGDNKKGSDCYDRTDSSCPPGTVYNDLNLSTIEATLGNALTVLGSWFGTVVENYPTEFYGRKPTLLFNCFIFIAGAAIACTGTSVYTLLIGRFFTGVGVGFSSGVPLVLLAEIATNATRGTITSLHQIMLTWGIFIAGVLSFGFVIYVNHGWQYLQGFGAIAPLIMLFCSYYIPESPKWLLSKHVALLKESHHHTALPAHDEGLHNDDHLNETADSTPYSSDKDEPHTVYYDQAREVLVALRDPSHDVDLELKDIIAAVRADAKASAVTWKEVFAYREGFIAGAGLLFFQAITGINAVVSYSTTLFSLAGFSQSVIGTMLIGAVRLVVAYIEFETVNTLSRRFMLLTSAWTMFISLVVMGVILLSPVPEKIQGGIAAAFLLIFCCGFAFGMGSVIWTVISEILPTRIRMKATISFLSLNWFISFLVCFLTLFAINGLGGVKSGMTTDEQARARKKGVGILFLIFAFWGALCLIFINYYVPETKGRNPEDSTKLSQKKELQEPPGNDIEERSHSRMLDPSSYAAVSNHSSSKQQQDQPTNDNVHNDNNTTNINDDNGGSTSHQLVELTGIKTEIVLKDDHDDGNDHSGDNSSTSLPV